MNQKETPVIDGIEVSKNADTISNFSTLQRTRKFSNFVKDQGEKPNSAAIRYLASLSIVGKVYPEIVGRELPSSDIVFNDQVITISDIDKRNRELLEKLDNKAMRLGIYKPGQELTEEERGIIRSFLLKEYTISDDNFQEHIENQYYYTEELLKKIKARETGSLGASSNDGNNGKADDKKIIIKNIHEIAKRFVSMQDTSLQKHALEYLAILAHRGSAIGHFATYKNIFHSSAESLGITENGIASEATRTLLKSFFLERQKVDDAPVDFHALKAVYDSVLKTIEAQEKAEIGYQNGAATTRSI